MWPTLAEPILMTSGSTTHGEYHTVQQLAQETDVDDLYL